LQICINGLVIKENAYGESDKLLTVLTADYGRITVMAKGVRSFKNHNMPAAQLLCYDEMVLYKKNDRFWLREAAVIEDFREIRNDLDTFLLAQYLADLLCEVCVEGNPAPEELRLGLNTFYMLASGRKDRSMLKATFELRLAMEEGFCPDLTACELCRCVKFSDIVYLDVMNGVLKCGKCFSAHTEPPSADEEDRTATLILSFSPTVLAAMRYVVSAPPERIFAYNIDAGYLPELEAVCEKYLLNHLERGFTTLDFYKDTQKIV